MSIIKIRRVSHKRFCLPLCLSCMSLRSSLCLSVYLFVCLSVCLSVRLSDFLPVLSAYLPVCLSHLERHVGRHLGTTTKPLTQELGLTRRNGVGGGNIYTKGKLDC